MHITLARLASFLLYNMIVSSAAGLLGHACIFETVFFILWLFAITQLLTTVVMSQEESDNSVGTLSFLIEKLADHFKLLVGPVRSIRSIRTTSMPRVKIFIKSLYEGFLSCARKAVFIIAYVTIKRLKGFTWLKNSSLNPTSWIPIN